MSNKLIYIIGGVVVLLLVWWLFTSGFASLAGAPAGVDVDRNMDGSTTYTSDEGTVTVGNQSMPDDWPSDAPANFAGASITFSGTSNPQTGQAGSAVSYTVRATASAVADYYKQQLQSSGWTIESTVNAGGAMVVSARKDTRTFGAYIVDAGDGMVAVTAGIEL